jgi:hypothetical protein
MSVGYFHVDLDGQPPRYRRQCSLMCASKLPSSLHSTSIPSIKHINSGLLCLSKEIRGKIYDVLQYTTIKRVGYDDLPRLAEIKVGRIPTLLNRLQLGFSDLNYCRFFRVWLPTRTYCPDPSPGPAPATCLRNMHHLRYIELWFDSTIDAGANVLGRLPGPPICREGMIDWILTSAYEYLKNIPTVSLIGNVKTETRTKWLHIFNDKMDGGFWQAISFRCLYPNVRIRSTIPLRQG